MKNKTKSRHVYTRFELMLTLECHWGCKDCCRAVDACYPPDSHLSLDQIKRLIQHWKDNNILIRRLKINGGDPAFHPNFEEAIQLFANEKGGIIEGIRVQTAFPRRVFKSKFTMPEGVFARCEPTVSKHYKPTHIPWFISPAEEGILKEGEPPPYGSWATKRACPLQRRCGRSFERWGFVACAQEGVLGRLLGIPVHEKEFKPWGDPEICKHCPMSLGKKGASDFQHRAMDGEFPWISKIFDFARLSRIYETFSKEKKPW